MLNDPLKTGLPNITKVETTKTPEELLEQSKFQFLQNVVKTLNDNYKDGGYFSIAQVHDNSGIYTFNYIKNNESGQSTVTSSGYFDKIFAKITNMVGKFGLGHFNIFEIVKDLDINTKGLTKWEFMEFMPKFLELFPEIKVKSAKTQENSNSDFQILINDEFYKEYTKEELSTLLKKINVLFFKEDDDKENIES